MRTFFLAPNAVVISRVYCNSFAVKAVCHRQAAFHGSGFLGKIFNQKRPSGYWICSKLFQNFNPLHVTVVYFR